MRVAEATAKGQTPDLEAYQAALRHALRGFLRRPGLVAQRTRQHSIYTVHVHSLRCLPLLSRLLACHGY